MKRIQTFPAYFFGFLMLMPGLFISASCPAVELDESTILGTSDAGNVTYGDIYKDWPHLQSEREKIRLVRQALKERIYAREALEVGIDEDPSFEEKLREVRLAAYLEALFRKKVDSYKPTEKEMKAFYQQNRPMYYLDEHLYLRHISVDIEAPSDPEARALAKTKAIEALARLKSGEDFEKVAREYSSDDIFGAWPVGPVPIRAAPEGWGQEIIELEPGQLSDVIELETRFEIIEVLGKKNAGYQSFEQVKPVIRQRLLESWEEEQKTRLIAGLIQSMPAKINHEALGDPECRGSKTVVDLHGFKMSKENFDRWLTTQPFMTRRKMDDRTNREAIIRKNLLLAPYVEHLADKERLEREQAFEEFYNEERRRLLSRLFEDYLYHQNPSFLEVSREEVQEYYAGHVDQFRTPRQAEIRDIIVKAGLELAKTPEERLLAFRYAEEQAREVLQKIKDREIPFALGAAQYESGMLPGDFYLVDEGTRGEKFDEVVFNQLKPGELVSEPIRVEDGYVVVQLAKVLPQDQWPLTRVEESIRNTLRRRKEEQLQKRLEATYFAKYNAKVLEESFLDQAE